MKEIGGYFELELLRNESFMHSDGIKVNSGRHALEYILLTQESKPTAIWVPDYTCEVVFEPLNRLGFDIKFYPVNEKLEFNIPNIGENEMIIANNYLGIKDSFINNLATALGGRLIIDNSQAWYFESPSDCNSFYSPRKFFGLPDGGIAYTVGNKQTDLVPDFSFDRCSHLLQRLDGETALGYEEFHVNSAKLKKCGLKKMSRLTEALLSSIDFQKCKEIRLANYQILRDALEPTNSMRTPEARNIACPMVYPFLTDDISLRKRLISEKVFVATYWPNVKKEISSDSTAWQLADHLLPLPIDQRYDESDMQRIIELILA